MKLLRVLFKTFLRNRVPPPDVMIRGFAAAWTETEKTNWKGLADETTYNKLVLACCRDGRVEEALGILRGMAESDENTYTSLIHLFCDQGQCDKAYKVFAEMIDTGFSPSVATYNAIVLAYCRDKRFREALGILRCLIERGFEPNLISFNALVQGFCGKGKMEEAEELLQEMNQKGLALDDKTYTSLIHLFCNKGKVEKAFEMKAEMVHKGILPDADTYGPLIGSLCLQQTLSEAFDLFQEMLRRGVSPDNKTYTGLMSAYRLQAQFSKAFHLQDEMIHKGFLPDFVTGISTSHVTYNAIIHGLCLLDRAEEALEILRGMPEIGLSPDAVSYSTVIFGFCRIRELGKAYKLKVEMDKKSISWLGLWGLYDDIDKSVMQGLSHEDTFSNLMSDYLAEGHLEKAYLLEREINYFDYLPVDVHYSVFLNVLNKKARITEAKHHLLWFISHVCLRMPTFIIYDTLIENCSNNEFKSVVGLVKGFGMRGLMKKAARAHDTMLEGNYKPDGAVYNLLIFDHCRCGNVHKAYDMYMEMVHYGFAPHMFSVLALIEALCCVRRYNKMSWVIQNTLRSCNLNDSELLQVLNEIDVREGQTEYLRGELAERAMDGLLLDGRKGSYASAST
ncbi:pentatricopeptide repeat-containing protein At5g39710-like [Lotus japonicus]|uniref:pentatricopeptide repeat-containing protein At5g39710-like n=1 Tax=Lotus japonicus TaxID=34305 RepID=UPI002583F93D|nr:pentatricopeptide repeat-containing protein At5g39710-like [Lotus japonicus]